MKKTFKSMLALMLVAVMCFGLVGTAAFADENGNVGIVVDGEETEDLAGNNPVEIPAVEENKQTQEAGETEEEQPEGSTPEESGTPAVTAPLTVNVAGGSYSYADGVITVTPDAGKYVKTVELNGNNVIEDVVPELESTVVRINVSKLGTVTAGDTLTVTTAEIPAKLNYSAYAETREGNFTFDMDLTDCVVSANYSYDEDGDPIAFLGYTVSDALIQSEDGLDNIIYNSNDLVGFYDYYSEKSMYIVFDSGASVAVPVGESVTFKPVLPFTVKVVAVVNIQFTIGGEFETYADIPDHFDLINEQGITVNADFNHTSHEFENVVISAQGNVLESGEYFLDLINNLILTNQAVLTITAPTEKKTYNGNAQGISGMPTLSVTEKDLGIKDVVYLYNDSETKPTEPGTYTVKIKSYTLTDNGANVANPTAFYTTINTVAGTLVIEPIKISVTLKDASAQYDGKAHTPAYTVSGSFLSEDDKKNLVVNFKTSVVNYTETPEVVEFDNGTVTGKSSYYQVTSTNTSAKVTITKAPITFTVGSCTKEYTGSAINATIKNEAHTDGDVTVTSTTFACADDKMDPDATISGSATNAGTYQILGLDGMTIYGAGGADVTANYAITVKKGTLTITPKAGLPKITITIKGAEKTYDGKDLILTSTSTMDDEAKKTVGAVTVSNLNLGSKPFDSTLIGNDITITLTGIDGTTVLSNADYSIEVIPAYAAIKKATLNITPASVTKNYDGNKYNGTITKSATFGGEAVTISATAKAYKDDAVNDGIAVGTYTLKVDPSTVTITNKDGNSIVGTEPITDYFNINCTASTLTVKASIGAATYSKSAGGTVTITCSLPKEYLQNVVVGNTILVEGTHYTINQNANGTAVTFKDAEFLKNLAVDNYSVVFNYSAPPAVAMKTTLKVTQNGVTSSTASPQTGDTSNTTLWTVILAVCFVIIVAAVVIIVRQKKKDRA